MSYVQDLLWCDATDEQGCLLHAPDCDQRNYFMVQEKKQETNTSGKAKLPDHYRCTITCALCGKRKHHEDECYHKQRLSVKLKTQNGSCKGCGKGNTDQGVARASPRVVAKAQRRAKVDEEAMTASRTRTRTRTSTEGSPILHQGGTLSPLVGSQIRGLRPVPRRKPNKNKRLSVPTKMGTSQTPANGPGSCTWRGKCRRRGLK